MLFPCLPKLDLFLLTKEFETSFEKDRIDGRDDRCLSGGKTDFLFDGHRDDVLVGLRVVYSTLS